MVIDESFKSLLVGVDFSKVESRMLAMLVTMGKDGMIYTPIPLEEVYKNGMIVPDSYMDKERTGIRGIKADLIIIDEAFDWPVPEVRELKSPLMKQNGRSAAYLAHDRTKQQGRKRR